MTTAYYSTVLDHPLPTVWALIRDFNNYPAYIDGVTESVIEDDKRRRRNRRGQALLLSRQLGPPASRRPFRRRALADLCRHRAASVSVRARARSARADALSGNDAPASGRRGQQDIHRMGRDARHRAAGCRALADAVPVLDSGLDPFARKGARPRSRVRLRRHRLPRLRPSFRPRTAEDSTPSGVRLALQCFPRLRRRHTAFGIGADCVRRVVKCQAASSCLPRSMAPATPRRSSVASARCALTSRR